MRARQKVRLATVAERHALEGLQLRASLSNAGDRDALLANPDAIELPDAQISAGLVFVAESGAQVMGFAAILPRTDGEIELDGLFVDPTARRSGVGRLLVDHCAAYGRSRGHSLLHVVGNAHASAFYHACGFKQFGTCETRFGCGLLLMKTL